MTEEEIIQTMFKAAGVGRAAKPGLLISAGLDAAVIQIKNPLVVSVDLSVEGTHFDLSLCSAEEAAWRAVSLAAPDLYAMGALPRFGLISLSLPKKTPPAVVRQLARGVSKAFAAADMALIGGDTRRGPAITLDVTVMGEQVRSFDLKKLLPGDQLGVTGVPGRSALALEKMQTAKRENKRLAPAQSLAYRRPQPDYALAKNLIHTPQVLAMTDISDSLVKDSGKLAGWAKLVAELDLEHLPAPKQRGRFLSPYYALTGGEDGLWLVAWRGEKPAGVTPVGRMASTDPRRKAGTVWGLTAKKIRKLQHSGFKHF